MSNPVVTDMLKFPDILWQTALPLAVGLIVSLRCRRRVGQAHFVLVLGLLFSLILPVSGLIVHRYGWGILTPTPPQVYNNSAQKIPVNNAQAAMSSSSQESAAIQAGVSHLEWAALTVTIISILLLARLIIQIALGMRLLYLARPLANESLQRELEAAARRFGLRAIPVTYLTDHVQSPAIWCWGLHPALLVPAKYFDAPSRAENLDWSSIFSHELAHLKRRDHLSTMFAEIACCLLWWNPLAWWTKRRIHYLSDAACDAWVLANGGPATAYAETLLSLILQPRSVQALSMASNRHGLESRLRLMLMGEPCDPRTGGRWRLATMFAAFACAALLALLQTGTAVSAEEQKPANPIAVQQISATPEPKSQTALLANASFELGDGRPDAWQQGAQILGVEYLWNRNAARTGEASLGFKKTVERYFPIAQWFQPLNRNWPANARHVELSAWVKAERAYKAILDVQFIDTNGKWTHQWAAYIGAKKTGDPPADHDWQQYKGIVNIPQGTATIRIALQDYGPGAVWFDDVEIKFLESAQ